ncbi:MAG: hypothetical protein OD814_001648, partial [Candidatus Alkanophagales archaeon MCA70_species_1]|nr:hypothetical protein [Candidatus Alkanophaga volatiphilum]
MIKIGERYVLVRLPYHVSARFHEECFEALKKLAAPLLRGLAYGRKRNLSRLRRRLL